MITLTPDFSISNVTACSTGLLSDHAKVASVAENWTVFVFGSGGFDLSSELQALLLYSDRELDGRFSNAKSSCTRSRHTRALERLGMS